MADPHAPASSSHGSVDPHTAAHVHSHTRGYLIVGAVLFFCTALTVGLSYVNFGTDKANIVVAMLVATFKAGVVAAIFMHLLSERWTIYRVLIFTVIFVLGLFFLTLLAFNDPIRIH